MADERTWPPPSVSPEVAAAVEVVAARLAGPLEVAIVAGSGLAGLAARVREPVIIPYEEIPGWPLSTVSGHAGDLALGELGGRSVAVARGRAHLYEGYGPRQATFGVRLLRALGARVLVVTNAAGGLNPAYGVGDVMVLADHICLPGLAGLNPLAGPNDDAVGPRFPGMAEAYDAGLRRLAAAAAHQAGFQVHEGVYVMVGGPSFETPAEIRLLRQLGADAVGMSTALEVIVARHAGMHVSGLSLITNVIPPAPAAPPAAGPPDLHAEVMAAGAAAAERLARVVDAIVRGLPD
jgi:purine-nucleoside phosphorylase